MVLVLSVATDRTKYVKEFEYSLQKLGYDYKLLGLGKKWEGFETKMKYYLKELERLDPNELVIVCDSYDILFVQGPQIIESRYRQLANNKVVVGMENIKDELCNFIGICIPEVVKKCKIKNKYYPDFKYINSGFIMGSVRDLQEIFDFMIQNGFKDDQKALFNWIMKNCSRCFFDYHLDFVFNYMPKHFEKSKVKVELLNNLIKVNNSTPCVVHTPAQYLDLGYRTEMIRNFIVNGRSPVGKMEYFKQSYEKSCSPEAYYIGYWWIFVVLIIIILILIFKN